MAVCQNITFQKQKESCGGTAHLECIPVHDAASNPVLNTVSTRACAHDAEQLEQIISGLSNKTVQNVTRVGEPEESTGLWDMFVSFFW